MDNLIIMLEEMDAILQSLSPIEVKVREKAILQFYEITQDSKDQYNTGAENPIVSPNYIMTLLAPFATKVIIKIFENENLPKIKGVVHSKSEINFLKPLSYGKYRIWCRVETLQKKTGKMGNYLVLTFRMTLLNENEQEVANDIHQFFIRVGEGDN